MRYGLLGEKLGHSFSKIIHEQISSINYDLIEVSNENFDSFMKSKAFKAINVTIPYKEKVIPYLHEIDEIASRIKAVNTIVNLNGLLYGYNTDYFGLKQIFIKNKVDVVNTKVLILGTGGTSKTAHVLMEDLKAKEIIHASINNEEFSISYDDIYKYHLDANIIINTTPCGMYPNNDDVLIDLTKFKKLDFVCDVIYNPLHTKLTQIADSLNIKSSNGLYMLVAQAVYASNIFLNRNLKDVDIAYTYKKLVKELDNIVLIGMPGCGKSTIGKHLAKSLNKKFVDTDTLIEQKYNIKISEFLNNETEHIFRNYEEAVIKEVSKHNNQIISCGGGVILKDVNIQRLKQNGIVIFIDRPLELLTASSSRPLSSTKELLEKKYVERIDKYLSFKDYIVKNDSYYLKAVDIIRELYENISY